MCIGIPMRVVEAWQGGALAAGRGRCERIDTRLVGDEASAPGCWLLVFQGAAREALSTSRAAEIDAALDLLDAAQAGDAIHAAADPGFVLPSSISAAQLAELTAPRTSSSGETP
ncbi:MAG: HypC/HybG/HupF family hydrogenase formation chaperone [Aquincola sp.]|nr:HypC/HybG/HupF family hydrogenase formation chaperone [Aquincola sp.]MDH5329879.1 HypC/HybG/HupF family hydrogenase formation chaperone [Aquincola sp.]